MNTSKSIFLTLLLVVVTMFVMSCREITTTTKIKYDGSCERTVLVKSKHKSHGDSYFPIPTDSTWNISNTKSLNDTAYYEYLASQQFKDVAAMQSAYNAIENTGAATTTIHLSRRYGLFYQYFRYVEVYNSYTPFSKIPVENFLSDEEIQTYLSDPDSSNLQDKVDEWRTHAVLEEIYQGILTKVKSLGNPELSPEKIEAKKDTLLTAVTESSDSTDEVLSAISEVLGTDSVNFLHDTIDVILQEIEREFDVIMQVGTNSYINQVILPGLLLDANADGVEGNMAIWKFPGEIFEFRDKEMWVESRILNWWGISISGLLVIIMTSLLVIVARRKRR